MKPEYLAGASSSGSGPRSPWTASQLLERLTRPETRLALAAAKDPEAFDAAGRAKFPHLDYLPSGDSAEHVMMQALSVGLDLATSHHPPLGRTFPPLLAWIRHTLGYVLRLEGNVDELERAAVVHAQRLETQADSLATRREQLETAALVESGLREMVDDRDRDLQQARGENRILSAERDAAVAGARMAMLALQVAIRADPRLAEDLGPHVAALTGPTT